MIAAAAAFLIWGMYPVFFRQIAHVPAAEILAWRIVFSCVILLVPFLASRRLNAPWALLRQPRRLLAVVAAAFFLSLNWFVFIYAVNSGQILQASLGYFLNPMLVSLVGVVFFSERLQWLKKLSVAVAMGGMLLTFVVANVVPVLALVMACSFAIYAVIRKVSPLDSSSGLLFETLVLVPVAIGWLIWNDTGLGQYDLTTVFWLAGSGVMTLVPLLAAIFAAQRIPLSTFGLFQYISPTMQLLIAVLVYGESMDLARSIAFTTTLLAVVLFVAGAIAERRSQATARLST